MAAVTVTDALSWEELEALGLCECGQPSDPALHDPLPIPKPLGRSQDERLVIPRYSAVVRNGRPSNFSCFNASRFRRTARLEEVIRILNKNGGHRDETARELGVSSPTVYAAIRRARALGIPVPPPGRGRRLDMRTIQ